MYVKSLIPSSCASRVFSAEQYSEEDGVFVGRVESKSYSTGPCSWQKVGSDCF